MTRLLDEAGIPLILVGDSLGMVVLGYPDTTHVTMEDMEHHVRAAARAKPKALLAADLPYRSYETCRTRSKMRSDLQAAGAEAVKAEGGRASIIPQVKAIVEAGIPFIGHLGMLPQHVIEEGGYHVKGRKDSEQQALLEDADALVEAGAFAIVLEFVAARRRKRIQSAHCDSHHRHRRRTGLRRPDPRHSGFAGHVPLVQPQTRKAQAERSRANARRGRGVEERRRKTKARASPAMMKIVSVAAEVTRLKSPGKMAVQTRLERRYLGCYGLRVGDCNSH